ncbi:zinc-dependent alcohol dehydrogenase family protein [Buttiauxella sp. S04-F03]|uniref:zinc-dependent alcohol dehydrogenase family protein n=1 Tax=Buttiauxella sp. W03-F01 TaxID=2904524 RepID=UPI001E317F01|nr:zinc-dependent alcohol dehydrogenase family protein [Buttiauxella sp. W03-F01]MCE0799194.1 zinc-dependent alcohol dehydrogenase family protein [Buttiauxella sp. W03-F01]
MHNSALWFRQFGQPEHVITLEQAELTPRPCAMLRVQMRYAPVNPSDLIPITGAYRHRVMPPRIVGYEGVGVVIDADNPEWIGKRVLPLRGDGTWQQWVDCPQQWAVPVPDNIPDLLAARGYINPLAAFMMLKQWPVRGRRVLLTAANSSCAVLLAQWATIQGATEVVGVCRKEDQKAMLLQDGIRPLIMDDHEALRITAQQADVVFDAVGGSLATLLLSHLQAEADFVSYGLLSGEPYQAKSYVTRPQRFHLRDTLAVTDSREWQQWFVELWPLLANSQLPDVKLFALAKWRDALREFAVSGRRCKPVLAM